VIPRRGRCFCLV